jgi:hypothetical protein
MKLTLPHILKLYKFIPADEKREVTINSKDGMLNDKEEGKGRLITFSVKTISKDNYMILLPEQLEAGGVWICMGKKHGTERTKCVRLWDRLEKQRLTGASSFFLIQRPLLNSFKPF